MKWKSTFSQKDFHLSETSSYGKNIKEKGKLIKDMKGNFVNPFVDDDEDNNEFYVRQEEDNDDVEFCWNAFDVIIDDEE